jgi:hypothetical protein
MQKSVFISALTILFLSSCNYSNKQELETVYQDGRGKPHLTILQVVDSSQNTLPWDLSHEMTSILESQIKAFGAIYLEDQEQISTDLEYTQLAKKIIRNPNEIDAVNSKTEFLSIVEIIDHQQQAIHDKKNLAHPEATAQLLTIKARVKVYDLRKAIPSLVLSEIINHESTIPWQMTKVNYKKNHYMTKQYLVTPIGLAHKQLMHKTAKRIHDYVLLAKSH